MNTIIIILTLIFAVALWVMYHKIFDVVYFNLSKGIFKEIIVSLVAGLFLTGLTLMYWWITDILIALIAIAGVFACKRSEQKILVIVGAVILGIVVMITGIAFNNQQKKEQHTTAQVYDIILENERII